MKKARIRQHVNPLSEIYLIPITPPDWKDIYQNPRQPLHLDLGCARGRFILQMAQLHPEINFLGIEIRNPLVIEAIEAKNRAQLTNLHYLSGNINSSGSILLSSLPTDLLQCITVQFPDPWFKHKHLKRRMLQPDLINYLVKYLLPEGSFFIQSDILAVAQEMKRYLQAHQDLILTHTDEWLDSNPMPIPTEREIGVINKGETVYRAFFKKKVAI